MISIILQNRPQTFRHGDYHIGNFILDSQNHVHVIDFGLSDYGDPWEEFNRIIWTVQKSPILAAGMINGYFDNSIPAEFWELMALYLCSKALYALPWSLAYGEELYNNVNKMNYIRLSETKASEISQYLTSHGIQTKVVVSKGRDIDGGCGQLRNIVIKSDDVR